MKNALCLGAVLVVLQTSLLGWQNQAQPISEQPARAADLDSSSKQTPASIPTSETLLLPKGTPVCMFSTHRMSSKIAKLNDRVVFRVAKDVSTDGLTIIAKDTEVWGTVTEAQKPGLHPHSAKLSFAFEDMRLVNGQTAPIRQSARPKESVGKDIKETWEIGGPWLIPFLPLYYLQKDPDEVLTRSTCLWVSLEREVHLDKAELSTLQLANPSAGIRSASNPTSVSSMISAGIANSPELETHLPQQVVQPRITEIEVGFGPGDIVFTPGAIWVAWGNSEDEGISRIDANTNQVVATILGRKRSAALPARPLVLDCCPTPLAAGEGALWASDGKDQVSRIDPTTNQVVATIPVAQSGFLAVGEGSVWVTQGDRKSVSRIDPQTNRVIAAIQLEDVPLGISAGSGAVWVMQISGISRIDPQTNTVGKTIHLRGPDWPFHIRRTVYPKHVMAQGGDVWVTASNETVVRIDAKSKKIVACIRVPPRKDFFILGQIKDGEPHGAAILDGLLWVADWANETLWKIDIRTNKIVGEPVLAGFHPQILGPGNDGNGAIWVSNQSDGTVMKVKP